MAKRDPSHPERFNSHGLDTCSLYPKYQKSREYRKLKILEYDLALKVP
jgi:hypothetical protein